LAEIDENLIRCNLTPAQEAAAISRSRFVLAFADAAEGAAT
jgi:hypothetical protein